MIPSLGRIVHYTLTDGDATAVTKRRNDAAANRAVHPDEDNGYIAHVGNAVSGGDVYPLIITRVWAFPDRVTEESQINGQVLLDGNDCLWVTSAGQGDQPGQWREPGRVG